MTLNLSAHSWLKPTLIFTAIVAVIGVWAYLAGGIFLLAFGRDFNDASPLTLYQYGYHYGTEPAVERWLYIASAISLALLLSPGLLFLSPNKRSLFGDARFATGREIRKAGLFGDRGIIVGSFGFFRRRYLIFGGSQHAIMSAPTRSGKGVGVVIPNLLHWPDSVVVLDIKQENWAITSAFRRKCGQPCYLFNPAATDYRTHRYNPLAYISADPNFRIDDVQKIANMLFPDQPGTDVIWTATPRSLFLGVVLFLFETPGKLTTLGQVLRESLADGDGATYFARIINERAGGDNALSGACVRALNSYISIASENTRSGIMTSFRSRLELWMNPLVDAATSANDFDLRDVRKKRMSIYVGVTPDNLERLAPLLNLFFQQLIDLNTRELPERNPALKYQCLLLPDEFTAMGKIACLSKGISYIAGYGLRMLPIVQSPAQVIDTYGEQAAKTFTQNHALQIVFPPKASDVDTAEAVSRWLGYQTVKGTSESKGKNWFSKKQKTESVSDQKRALLLPQEITALGKKRQLVVMEDVPPILATKIKYYEDAVFIDRLKSVSPSLNALGNRLPKEAHLKLVVMIGELSAKVPVIDVEEHNRLVSGETTTKAVAPRQGGETKTVKVERAFTADDIPKLDKLSLADFAVDFSAVKKPQPGELDEAALHAYADSLCQQVGIHVGDRHGR